MPNIDHAQAAIDLIDGLLDPGQHSPESDQYQDVAPTITDRCWRCQVNDPAPGSRSGLCDGCREYMLDDTEVDPAAPVTADDYSSTIGQERGQQDLTGLTESANRATAVLAEFSIEMVGELIPHLVECHVAPTSTGGFTITEIMQIVATPGRPHRVVVSPNVWRTIAHAPEFEFHLDLESMQLAGVDIDVDAGLDDDTINVIPAPW